jgi:hypothetical protein
MKSLSPSPNESEPGGLTPAPTASVEKAPTQVASNDAVYLPTAANDANYTPPHTHTQSTLAPTSEYVRYLLLALPARYIPRGIVGAMFETNHYDKNALGRGLAKIAGWCQKRFGIEGAHAKSKAEQTAALTYNAAMGLGSLALTASYSNTVYKDIRNIFAEAVALETGKSANDITSNDLRRSDNLIVQKTMHNFWKRMTKRLVTDLLFFPAAWARSEKGGDIMVGVKAGQAFTETWKRKTTMFEDLVTFVNNKINPRNGLGQQISIGEVFDLYQHYADTFHPDRMFSNVLDRSSVESTRWAQNQPIFERMTELMNLTYAYKHSSVIDANTGQALHQANFALPKFIYLLGHDMIDIRQPERTMATIEIANRFGIPAVKEMQTMLASGATLDQVTERFPIPAQAVAKTKVEQPGKNGVIAKGSTLQLDVADGIAAASTVSPESSALSASAAAPASTTPASTINVDSILGRNTLANQPGAALATS